MEHLIGFLSQALIMRVDASGNPTFAELVGRVRDTVLEAYANSDIELSMPWPLFRVHFNYVPEGPKPSLDGLRVREWEGSWVASRPRPTGVFELAFAIRETANGLTGGVRYNTLLYDRSTIRRWLLRYDAILESICTSTQD